MLLPSDLHTFQAIYRKHFGREIDDREALALATALLSGMQCVLSPPDMPVSENTNS